MRLPVLALLALPAFAQGTLDYLNHNRPVLDAHNCYPYKGQWADRIDRALGTGFPVGIEQDLAWYVDPATGKGRVVVSHTEKVTGAEPELRTYFFERVRPIIEKALAGERSRAVAAHRPAFRFQDGPARPCCTPSGISSASIRAGSPRPPRAPIRIR